MFDAIVSWSLNNRLAVLVLSAALVVGGLLALQQLPIDAFPDTTPIQVQINTNAPSLNPVEIEQQITFPVEQAIGGIPGLIDVRSISKFGLSQVVAIFDDDTDVYFARQLIGERITEERTDLVSADLQNLIRCRLTFGIRIDHVEPIEERIVETDRVSLCGGHVRPHGGQQQSAAAHQHFLLTADC